MKKNFQTHYIKLAITLLIICGFSSACKKLIVIPENPPNQIPESAVFADSTDVMSAMAGVYNGFGAASGVTSFLSGQITEITGLSGDELSATQAYDQATIDLENNNMKADNNYPLQLWSGAYGTANLYQVNACLVGINASTGISPALKKQLIAELKVVRALYYFNLVNLFGGVPIVVSTNYTATAKLPRATVEQIYAQVIADLTDAQSNISPDYPSAGKARPNLLTVKALFAKVYLYRGQWQKAADMASDVISSGNYTLETDLNNVFLTGSSEAIWQLPANGIFQEQTPEARDFLPYPYSPGSTPNYQVTDFLRNAFEANDPRKGQWINVTQVQTGATTFDNLYYPYKYKDWDNTAATKEDYMVLRLGEQYLIRAEALAELGNIGGAVVDLNTIRTRARGATTALPAYQPTISQADCLAAVMHERQVELFCEWGNRWFDLKRSATINTVLGSEKPGWKATDALYPIPRAQIQLNPSLTQNPGYN
jgi:hypothetical protein